MVRLENLRSGPRSEEGGSSDLLLVVLCFALLGAKAAYATPPSVQIAAPSSGDRFAEGVPIRFAGSATDDSGASLGDTALSWRSDRAGLLATGSELVYPLGPGRHLITLRAVDSMGETGQSTVSIDVLTLGQLPKPVITMPAITHATLGQPLELEGAATDLADGALPPSAFTWSSSVLGGSIVGNPVTTTVEAVLGTHLLTLRVVTARGATAEATREVAVIDSTSTRPPVIDLLRPLAGLAVPYGSTHVFEARAWSDSDGVLTPAVEWSANGQALGSGGSISFSSNAVTPSYVVRARAVDSAGRAGEATAAIALLPAIPVPAIWEPEAGRSFYASYPLLAQGGASSPDYQVLTGAALDWSVDGGASIGTGNLAVTTALAPGWHVLGLRATNSYGVSATATRSVQIQEPPTPMPAIHYPSAGSTFRFGERVNLWASVTNAPDGDQSYFQFSWKSHRQGPLGVGACRSTTSLVVGQHIVTLTSTNRRGGTASATVTVRIKDSTAIPGPHVEIQLPISAGTYYATVPIQFSGGAYNAYFQNFVHEQNWVSSADGPLGGESMFVRALSPGNHVISLLARDSRGMTGVATRAVLVRPESEIPGPTVKFDLPRASDNYYETVPVTLRGSASDLRDASLPNPAYRWTGGDGQLLGTGSNPAAVTLPSGQQDISLTVTDSRGQETTITTRIAVVALTVAPPPAVWIASMPYSGRQQVVSGTPMWLDAVVVDVIEGAAFPDSRFTWTSPAFAGPIVGNHVQEIVTATHGVYPLTVQAATSRGTTGVGTGTLVVVQPAATNPPQIQIESPTEGAAIPFRQVVPLSARAMSASLGDISTRVRWYSGTTQLTRITDPYWFPQAVVSSVALTAIVTDDGNREARATTTFQVLPPTPIVEIRSPVSGWRVCPGDAVKLEAAGSDWAQGVLPAQDLRWRSDRGGDLGVGDRLSIATLSLGEHRITASISNQWGVTGSTSVTVFVTSPAPVVRIESPFPAQRLDFFRGFSFRGGAYVPVSLAKPLPSNRLSWTLDGAPLGIGALVRVAALPEGTHTVSLSALSEPGVTASTSVPFVVTTNACDACDTGDPADRRPIKIQVTHPVPCGQTKEVLLEAPVKLQATAIDIVLGPLPDAATSWRSSLQGPLGTGRMITTTQLAEGLHVLTVTATSSRGVSGSTTVAVRVIPWPAPTMEIDLNLPDGGTAPYPGQSLEFTGRAITYSPEALAAARMSWWLDDVPVGVGLRWAGPAPASGPHRMQVRYCDSRGTEGRAESTFTVLNPGPFKPRIVSVSRWAGPIPAADVTLATTQAKTIWPTTDEWNDPKVYGSDQAVAWTIVGTGGRPLVSRVTMYGPPGNVGSSLFSEVRFVGLASGRELDRQVISPGVFAWSVDVTLPETSEAVRVFLIRNRSVPWQSVVGAGSLEIEMRDEVDREVVSPIYLSFVPRETTIPVVTLFPIVGGRFARIGTPRTLIASASDPLDGSLLGGSIRWDEFVWSQNQIIASTTGTYWTTSTKPGVRLYQVTATNSGDWQSVASVNLVGLSTPTVSIAMQPPATWVLQGTPLSFAGNVSWGVEEAVPASFTWRSNLNGELGSLDAMEVSTLATGVQSIALRALGPAGLEATATRILEVVQPAVLTALNAIGAQGQSRGLDIGQGGETTVLRSDKAVQFQVSNSSRRRQQLTIRPGGVSPRLFNTIRVASTSASGTTVTTMPFVLNSVGDVVVTLPEGADSVNIELLVSSIPSNLSVLDGVFFGFAFGANGAEVETPTRNFGFTGSLGALPLLNKSGTSADPGVLSPKPEIAKALASSRSRDWFSNFDPDWYEEPTVGGLKVRSKPMGSSDQYRNSYVNDERFWFGWANSWMNGEYYDFGQWNWGWNWGLGYGWGWDWWRYRPEYWSGMNRPDPQQQEEGARAVALASMATWRPGHRETLFEASGSGLRFAFQLCTQGNGDAALGDRTHCFDWTLSTWANGKYVAVVSPEGRAANFARESGGSYSCWYSQCGPRDSLILRPIASGGFEVRKRDITLTFGLQRTGLVGEYASIWRLTRIENSSGERITLQYSRHETTHKWSDGGAHWGWGWGWGGYGYGGWGGAWQNDYDTCTWGYPTFSVVRMRLKDVTDGAGRKYSFKWRPVEQRPWSRSLLESVTEVSTNRVVSFTYDSRFVWTNRLARVSDSAKDGSPYRDYAYQTRHRRGSASNRIDQSFDAAGRRVGFHKLTVAEGGFIAETVGASGETPIELTSQGASRVVTVTRGEQKAEFRFASVPSGGQLTSVLDFDGRESMLTWGSARKTLDSVLQYDEEGRPKKTTFDFLPGWSAAKPVVITRDGKGWLRLSYDRQGNLIRAVDGENRETRFAWDRRRLLTSTRNAAGKVTAFGYDDLGRLLTVTDPRGATQRFDYNDAGQLIACVDAAGARKELSYDRWGKVEVVRGPMGQELTTHRDDAGRIERCAVRLGPGSNDVAETSFTHDLGDRIETVAHPTGTPTSIRYLIRDSIEDGAPGRFVRDAIPWQEWDVKTDWVDYPSYWRWTWSMRSQPGVRLSTWVGPEPSGEFLNPLPNWILRGDAQRSLDYDDRGNVVKDSLSDDRYDWDERHRISLVKREGGAAGGEALTYDSAGRWLTTTESVSPITSIADIALGGVTSKRKVGPEGEVLGCTFGNGASAVSRSYDRVGNLATETDANGAVTTFVYDVMDNCLERRAPGGRTTKWTYDDVGNVTSETDPGGHRTSYDYDLCGRMIRKTDPAGGVTAYGYDLSGRLESITDPRQMALPEGQRKSWTFGYDLGDRLRVERNPLGAETRFEYDRSGHLLSRTDAKGQTTAYSYDGNDRLRQVTYPDGMAVTLDYDAKQRLIAVSTPGYQLTHRYEGDVLVERKYTFAGRDHRVLYDRMIADRRVRVRLPDLPGQPELTYTEDVLGRLIQLDHPGVGASGSQSTRYFYDGRGNPTEIRRPNGVVTRYVYAPSGSVASVAHIDAQSSVLSHADYFRDLDGQVVGRMTPSGTEAFTYDANHRLIQSIGPADRSTMVYDAVGNVIGRQVTRGTTSWAEARDYDAACRLQTVAGPAFTTFAYDPNGNLTRKSRSGDVTDYEWNVRDQLCRVSTNGTVRADYTYHPLSTLLLKKSAPLAVDRYTLWNDQNPLADLGVDATGGLQTLAVFACGPGIDQLESVASPPPATSFTPLRDALSSTLLGLKDDNTTVCSYTYSPFGEQLAATPSPEFNRFTFTGREFHPESGLYYYRARWYDPTIQRFISSDPAGLAGGINRYAYCNNDPINYTDPLGLFRTPLSLESAGEYRLSYFPRVTGDTLLRAAPTAAGFGRFAGESATAGLVAAFLPGAGIVGGAARGLLSSVTGYSMGVAMDSVSGRRVTAQEADAGYGWSAFLGALVGAHSGLGCSTDAASGLIDPYKVRFSQSSIGYQFSHGGGSIDDLAEALRSGRVTHNDVPAIRLVERDSFLFSLDNRRLEAFRRAGTDIRYRMAWPEEVESQAWKFTTRNQGMSVRIKGGP